MFLLGCVDLLRLALLLGHVSVTLGSCPGSTQPTELDIVISNLRFEQALEA